ncbi:MAG: hypothetical protein RLZ98_3814 [Pseudomonadota bacterium]|jgi:hypothetical protein
MLNRMMRTAISGAAAVLLLVATSPASAMDVSPFSEEVSREVVNAEAQAALTAVGKVRGMELWGEVPVRVVTRQQVEAAIRAEQASLFPKFAGSDGHTELDIKMAARWLLAKYVVTEKAIFVVPENFAEQARATGDTWLTKRDSLRVFLVHEAAHAADDRMWNFSEQVKAVKDAESLAAMLAVTEGHAQLVARRVCKENGWTLAFERMTSSIGSSPPGLNIVRQQFMPLRPPEVGSSYHDGEAFMARVLEVGGVESVARAFREPPRNLQVISRPDWFLDPETEPPRVFNFDAGLDYVASGFQLQDWTQLRLSATSSRLRAEFANRPKEDVERLLRGVVRNRASILKPKIDPESKMMGTRLFEHSSEHDAKLAVSFKEANSRQLNGLLSQAGMAQILSAEYEPIESKDCHGFACQKRIRISGQEIPLVHVVLARGRAEVEIMAYGGVVTRPVAIDVAEAVLDKSQPSTGPNNLNR